VKLGVRSVTTRQTARPRSARLVCISKGVHVKMATTGRAKSDAPRHLRLAVSSINCRGNGKVVEVRGPSNQGQPPV
jgi:hypothetical protein